MTAFTSAGVEHKGIAYGLDKILDARWTNRAGAKGAVV